MFKNYCKIAWRNLLSNRLFSLLNIAGLAIGIAVSTLLLVFIAGEYRFDDMHIQGNRIYRVLFNSRLDGQQETRCVNPPAVAPSMAAEIPSISQAARMVKHAFGGTAFIKAADKNFAEKNLYWCDASLLRIFTVPFLKGNSQNALDRPNTVVLSASTAEKYFGQADPIGKTIMIDNRQTLEITGVYRDFPSNSTLDADLMACYQSSVFSQDLSWSNPSFETYCLLDQQTSPATAAIQLQQMINRHISKTEQWYGLSLQPLKQVHLYSDGYTRSYTSRKGSIAEVKNLVLLAILILVIACINYMNLFTARSQKRIKDVGINKTVGATAMQLVLRFYIETGILTLIAIVSGLALAVLAMPVFNSLTGKSLQGSQLLYTGMLWYLPLLGLVVTLIAGSYPALYLSRFSAKAVMLQNAAKDGMAAMVRKALVIVQFAASAVLIIAVTVIYLQLQYIRHKNLGYQPENVLAISTTGFARAATLNAFINDLNSQGDVQAVSRSQGFPGIAVSGKTLRKNILDKEGISIQSNHTDHRILDVLHTRLLSGTGLPSVKQEQDTLADIVVNSEAVRYLGFTPENAIGRQVWIDNVQAVIKGVVDNFNYASLHIPVGAYAFTNSNKEPLRYLLVRFSSGNLPHTIQTFEKLFKKHVEDAAFDFVFLDKHLASLYQSEQRMAQITLVFSLLAIFVACLGLFGLSAFMAEQRTKEIGIRKVFGANAASIVVLLSVNFIKLVLLSVILASPVAWWFTHSWLQHFAYRIPISIWLFAATGVIVLLLAFITISFQAIKAARANPVKNLKTL